MAATRTLVFGDDSSPTADIAWLLVNSHAWPGWRLEIVAAHVPDDGLPAAGESDLRPWNPPVPRHTFAEAGFDEVVNLTTAADPRLALSRGADLVVVGPRGPGLLKSLHIGSTADWLLLHPPAPLLIARHGQPVHRVVLCTDGSPHSDRVTDALVALPWAQQLDVTVLTVDDGRTDVESATFSAAHRLEVAGASVNVVVEAGQPTPTIGEFVDRAAPDLVAMGTLGLTGLRHLRLGSTAGAIARAASCSVLVACDEDEYLRDPLDVALARESFTRGGWEP